MRRSIVESLWVNESVTRAEKYNAADFYNFLCIKRSFCGEKCDWFVEKKSCDENFVIPHKHVIIVLNNVHNLTCI